MNLSMSTLKDLKILKTDVTLKDLKILKTDVTI
jgi:hypothetical protein